MVPSTKKMTMVQREKLISLLASRFERNRHRHKGLDWHPILKKLETHEEKLWSLYQMEQTGGEPDVIGLEARTRAYLFCDCAKESPKGRRSLCYDREALESRKKHKPRNSAMDLAVNMGIEILTEEAYRGLQQLDEFDLKTSSWIKTPEDIRKRNGALFCDRRYNKVFLYHNSAESYYASRGFRGILSV